MGTLGDKKRELQNERRPRLSWMVDKIKDVRRRMAIVEIASKESERILTQIKKTFEEMMKKDEKNITDEPTDSVRATADNGTVQPMSE